MICPVGFAFKLDYLYDEMVKFNYNGLHLYLIIYLNLLTLIFIRPFYHKFLSFIMGQSFHFFVQLVSLIIEMHHSQLHLCQYICSFTFIFLLKHRQQMGQFIFYVEDVPSTFYQLFANLTVFF